MPSWEAAAGSSISLIALVPYIYDHTYNGSSWSGGRRHPDDALTRSPVTMAPSGEWMWRAIHGTDNSVSIGRGRLDQSAKQHPL
ncbi:hypothetical protein [Streptosporangium sp. NPDC000396]|uniref:hypothetical protein n=1 Tax=Streptosporangium sp. NPDC000396 TaxID=3366185 RepID=UPI0036841E09